jgi:aryl-alcohol dehydrogenase-like predicted oxidoreductase
MTTALIGASRPEQIVENVNYRDRATFTPDELKQIDELLAT